MISAAWAKVDMDVIRKSFIKSEIPDRDQISGPIGDEVVGNDEDTSILEISCFNEDSFIGDEREFTAEL